MELTISSKRVKKLAGEPHGYHKGYVFSNAWVLNTVEAMCLALMVDPQGDQEIIKAQAKMRETLEDWIPKILSAQEPDGYLQTAFTLPRIDSKGNIIPGPFNRWERRGDHEGYVAGYFLEAAISHYLMTNKRMLAFLMQPRNWLLAGWLISALRLRKSGLTVIRKWNRL